jgi:hypothetical protein
VLFFADMMRRIVTSVAMQVSLPVHTRFPRDYKTRPTMADCADFAIPAIKGVEEVTQDANRSPSQ